MHNYEYETGTNILNIIEYFESYGYRSDGNDDEIAYPSKVVYMSKTYTNISDAKDAAGDQSYWDGTSIAITRCVTGKITKAFENAYINFKEKRKDYRNFEKNLTIAYGRKSAKVTCPHCHSMINIQYGRYYTSCPVCGSKKIISDSNWKTLETKKGLVKKASEMLSREAAKCGITFVGAIGWHS